MDLKMKPCLYVVATPIGNLDDFTPRAQAILQSVDLICAEDTRHSSHLLSYFNIKTPLISLHEHNERERTDMLLSKLQEGKTLALISDAGTPLISDPGFILVRTLKSHAIPVIPIPGACAAITALSVCGLPTDRFIFEGFLSAKANARQQQLLQLKDESRTLIFYESSHRIVQMLNDAKTILGAERLGFIGREITKKFESYLNLNLNDLHEYYQQNQSQIRGEFVVIIEGVAKKDLKADKHELDLNSLLSSLLKELPLKKVTQIVSELTGLKKNYVYEQALIVQNNVIQHDIIQHNIPQDESIKSIKE
ncbi:ribosomal RNA small subunit methyltransferase I [Gammaproteobacteria bacterium]|nr:ribosomal RNA small subunit methyltransferase I [Gammaproteobacteria bacterium]